MIPAVAITAAVAAYNRYFFGHLLGGYDSERNNVALSNVVHGLPGLLFSPGFGLFVYFPIAAVAVGLLVARPRMLAEPTVWAASATILLIIVFVSAIGDWAGGFSYGPRYLSEAEALILLLVGLGWTYVRPAARQSLAIACFGFMLPYSIMVQAAGVYSPAAWKWTVTPGTGDRGGPLERAWDVADNPITRGLHLTSARPPAAQ